MAREIKPVQMPSVPAMPKLPDARIIPLDRQTPLTHAQVEQVRFGLGDTGPLAQAVMNANVPALQKQLTIGAVSCLAARKPADPVVGQMIYETDTQLTKFWNGTAWVNTSAPPNGVAGGGLTGTYPNPTVASIAGLAAAGDLTGTYPNPTITNITNAPIYNSNTTLSFRTSSTERMSVDASGRVKMPYQPAFYGFKSGGASTGVWVADTSITNRGNHYNTGTGLMTCPAAGVYCLYMTGLGWTNPGYGYLRIQKNGVNQGGFSHWNMNTAAGSTWTNPSILGVVDCAVNDTINIYVDVTGGNSGVYNTQHNNLSIYFLG